MPRARAAAAILLWLAAAARGAGADVVVLGVPKPGLFTSPPGFYREVAEEAGVPYEGEALRRILTEPGLKSDPIHPNAAGYRRLAEAVRDLLVERGALPGAGGG